MARVQIRFFRDEGAPREPRVSGEIVLVIEGEIRAASRRKPCSVDSRWRGTFPAIGPNGIDFLCEIAGEIDRRFFVRPIEEVPDRWELVARPYPYHGVEQFDAVLHRGETTVRLVYGVIKPPAELQAKLDAIKIATRAAENAEQDRLRAVAKERYDRFNAAITAVVEAVAQGADMATIPLPEGMRYWAEPRPHFQVGRGVCDIALFIGRGWRSEQVTRATGGYSEDERRYDEPGEVLAGYRFYPPFPSRYPTDPAKAAVAVWESLGGEAWLCPELDSGNGIRGRWYSVLGVHLSEGSATGWYEVRTESEMDTGPFGEMLLRAIELAGGIDVAAMSARERPHAEARELRKELMCLTERGGPSELRDRKNSALWSEIFNLRYEYVPIEVEELAAYLAKLRDIKSRVEAMIAAANAPAPAPVAKIAPAPTVIRPVVAPIMAEEPIPAPTPVPAVAVVETAPAPTATTAPAAVVPEPATARKPTPAELQKLRQEFGLRRR